MTPATLFWFVLLTPLAGFAISLGLGKSRKDIVGWITAGLSVLNLLFTLGLSKSVVLPTNLRVEWFKIGQIDFSFGFLFDSKALMMLLLVNFIAFLVQLFSLEYMEDDPSKHRYFAFLQLFVFSMLGIILTDNLLGIYAFWELVGLSSYLLIGFWYQKDSATQAAKKAFLVNRVGDLGFLLGIFMVYRYWGSLSFSVLQQTPAHLTPALATITGLLLFCGCVGKSAQFPLHTWLPDAMEGPTPVSALIHAATMVAAGIFLLARIQPVFTDNAFEVIAGIGCITMLLGSFYAIFQTDIKKTLAYSTISQLGLMLIGLGTATSLFHLLTHAFFKAGLFLAAGSVIHALHHASHNHDFDAQDMRLMGGLRKKLPLTFITFVIFAASLAGLPLFSGFLSKDAILANLFHLAEMNSYFKIIGIFTFVGIVMTAFYMFRQVWQVFMGEYRAKDVPFEHIHEGSFQLKLPLILLAVLSLGVVFATNPFHADHAWFWHFIDSDFHLSASSWIGFASMASAGLGISLGYLTRNRVFIIDIPTLESLYKRIFVKPISEHGSKPQSVGNAVTYFDALYELVFVKSTLLLARFLQYIDANWIDGGVNQIAFVQKTIAKAVSWTDASIVDGGVGLVARVVGVVGKMTRAVQNGKVQFYIFAALVGLLGLIFFFIY
ncbi:MAG: NADH-quinone oxidoreductase subunit L [Flectobacillus sp.]|uniref:NADH-quinone oxidoreductase subunit L n=1 Tax=Flectobacillus sp. TaxID=50419 RepID=UPI003B9DB554